MTIKDYLIQTDIEISEDKFSNVLSLEQTYLPFRFRIDKAVKVIIKYIIYAYPNKDNQREGMPILPQERGLNTSDRHRRFANMILNFDADFKVDLLNSLSLEERGYCVSYESIEKHAKEISSVDDGKKICDEFKMKWITGSNDTIQHIRDEKLNEILDNS